MMVVHSDRDYRCLLEGGLAAFNVLQVKGVPSKFLNFPDEVCLSSSNAVARGKEPSASNGLVANADVVP